MRIFYEPRALQKEILALRGRGRRIALVPTMGNLHEGHVSLVREAVRNSDTVIVSIFVNPTQFAPNEDFAAYPRTFEDDQAMIAAVAPDAIIFCPDTAAMYAPDASVWVDEMALSTSLCGRARPGHFRGVCTVVTKLFHIALPDLAFFGQKDAQQALIIRRMVRDLDFPIEIVVLPTVREPDGLAMSSRNRFLSPGDRAKAPALYAALAKAETLVRADRTLEAKAVRTGIVDAIMGLGGVIDYVEVLSSDTLMPVENCTTALLIALAYKFGPTRLLDNVVIQ
ncbi:pantoate--beta-alanine ligase [Trypanosoma grayi]|uniref:pantoate--beta-alanine ligase n=1 Tax=Trypanosoma grayi TaxID=71804 RepID=UPI0004F483E9|nr:pantoate--beta-alanine ligase [Trypanosoma grayi]KEG14226.1 pantoate--beta-alanine ligase [Trypanosoma grayi]